MEASWRIRQETQKGRDILNFSVVSFLTPGLILSQGLLLDRITPGPPAMIQVEGADTAILKGGVIRYQDVGEGSHGVLLLHGFNGQLGVWNRVWPHLSACGRVIRLDIPGYGGSNWRTEDYSLPIQAKRVVAFMDAIDLEKATLVGASMGGSLAAWMAAEYPERIQSAVLIAPSGYPSALTHEGLFGQILGPGPVNWAATRIARTSLYRRLFPRSKALHALTVSASYGEGWASILQRIQAPTLLLWSVADPVASPESAEAVHERIPNSALIWLDSAARHDIPNARPELVAAVACLVSEGIDPGELSTRVPATLWEPGDQPAG